MTHFVFLSEILHVFQKIALPLHPQNRDVAQLVAHYVRDVGVGRSSRLIPTFDPYSKKISGCLAITYFCFTYSLPGNKSYFSDIRPQRDHQDDVSIPR